MVGGFGSSTRRDSSSRNLRLEVLEPSFAICRLDRAEKPLTKDLDGPFSSLSITDEEVSLVCVESAAPQNAEVEGGWRCLKVEGPLSFSEVGILSSLTTALAEAGVSLFVVSTWDTDYLMVKQDNLEAAIAVLSAAGHEIAGSR